MLEGGPAATEIEEWLIDGGPAISAAAYLARKDVAAWVAASHAVARRQTGAWCWWRR